MTGDYLKQLQGLTKQLEQRTKEAARNRKEAEEKMAESEKAIIAAKSFDAQTAEAEKLLEESRHANQQKDYKEALGLAAKALEAADVQEDQGRVYHRFQPHFASLVRAEGGPRGAAGLGREGPRLAERGCHGSGPGQGEGAMGRFGTVHQCQGS